MKIWAWMLSAAVLSTLTMRAMGQVAADAPVTPVGATPAAGNADVPVLVDPAPIVQVSAISTTTMVAPKLDKQLRINIAWQVALDGSDYSPGILDGAFQKKGTMALTEYAKKNFPGAKIFDVPVYQALKVDVDGAVTNYTITSEDAAQVGGTLPDDWNSKAQMTRLNYESMLDCVTEKFHSTEGLLQKLNPGMKLGSLTVGQTLVVPNIRNLPADYHLSVTRRQGAASVTVNLGEKTIRVFDRDGGELALFFCSIAKDKNKLPDRDMKVVTIAAPNPNYTFDPKVWPEVHNVSSKLTIPPGPRNPVGLAWVSMDLPGYGIHGSPKPEMIGKTGSHGCFRLCNWDALKFAAWVREGMVVKVVNPDVNPQ